MLKPVSQRLNKRLLTLLATLALPAAMFAVAVGAAGVANAATCVPANNIEAIIDDSGSMTGTDPNANRATALELLASKSGNAKKLLSALEFGSEDDFSTPPLPGATGLFNPEPMGTNQASIKSILDTNLIGDHGSTDYNAAFALAKTLDPAATARIFLTDGGHDVGDYLNGHLGGPPTYVVGLDIGAASATDENATRLQTIANDTGGVYYPNVTSNNIDSTVNQIDAALNCQAIANTFTDNFTKAGQKKPKSLNVSSTTKSIDLVLTWSSPLDAFSIGSISLKPKHGAAISIAKSHLKIKKSSGKTFLSVHVKGLKKGKLKFKLQAKTLTSGFGAPVTLTTQATQSKKH